MRRALVAAVAVALVAAPLAAQGSKAQDSTLAGVKRVALVMHAQKNGDQLRDAIALDLRKTGIRVVSDSTPLTTDDGILAVYSTNEHNLATYRLILLQRAQLVRDPTRGYWMVTWQWDAHDTYVRNDWQDEMSKKALNEFISRWLDMNGR